MNKHIFIFTCLGVWVMIIIAIYSCGKVNLHTNPEIQVHLNNLTISWNGVARLKGGVPVLENSPIKFREVHAEEKDTLSWFEFIHNFKDHVEVACVISPHHESLIFYLSPNNFHTQKAKDFVGLEFHTFPGFLSATSLNPTTDSTVLQWQPLAAVSALQPLGAKLVVIAYADKSFAAILPLAGKGYKATAGVYDEALCIKSYHSQDGHSAKAIPLVAVAFAKDPSVAVKKVIATAQELVHQQLQLSPEVLQSLGKQFK